MRRPSMFVTTAFVPTLCAAAIAARRTEVRA